MSHAPVNATELSCAEYTEELTQFRMGLLDEADAEVAQQHLYACPDCRLFTHQVETVTDLVADAEPQICPICPTVSRSYFTTSSTARPRGPAIPVRSLASSLDSPGVSPHTLRKTWSKRLCSQHSRKAQGGWTPCRSPGT